MKKFLPAAFNKFTVYSLQSAVFFFLCSCILVFLPSSVFAFSDTTASNAGSLYFIHQDHLGSVIAVSDEEGNLVQQTKYAPYGNTSEESRSLPRHLGGERGYTGQIFDQNTALQYYNARYYDPTLSRFISADSAGGGNRFAYVNGNPVMANDPSGNAYEIGGDTGYRRSHLNPPSTQTDYGQIGTTSVSGGTLGGSSAYADWGQTAGQNDLGRFGNSVVAAGMMAGTITGEASVGFCAKGIIGYCAVAFPYSIAQGVISLDRLVYSSSNERDSSHPLIVGMEWLTGMGERERSFAENDFFTKELKKHYHVEAMRSQISQQLQDQKYSLGSAIASNYSLTGVGGVANFMLDYSSLRFPFFIAATSEAEGGGLAATYLGSYNLEYTITAVDKEARTATVAFHAWNKSNLGSLTHLPIVGYSKWWQENVVPQANNLTSSGWMSETSQDFSWQESISY